MRARVHPRTFSLEVGRVAYRRLADDRVEVELQDRQGRALVWLGPHHLPAGCTLTIDLQAAIEVTVS